MQVLLPANDMHSSRTYSGGGEVDLKPNGFYVLQFPRVFDGQSGAPGAAIVHAAVNVTATSSSG